MFVLSSYLFTIIELHQLPVLALLKLLLFIKAHQFSSSTEYNNRKPLNKIENQNIGLSYQFNIYAMKPKSTLFTGGARSTVSNLVEWDSRVGTHNQA